VSTPLDRVYDLLEATRVEDEQSDPPIQAGTKAHEAEQLGVLKGRREARAELRQAVTDAMQPRYDDPLWFEMPREWQGIFITHGHGVVSQLADTDAVHTAPALSKVERAVAVARLRAWADALEDVVEVTTLGGERIQ
jgi:hypothetical protein